jgi:two-component system, OmpR family, sensor histidine kinase QseC
MSAPLAEPQRSGSLRGRVLVTTMLVCTLVWSGWAAWQAQRMLRPDAGFWDEHLLGFTTYVAGSTPLSALELPPVPRPAPMPRNAPYKASVFQVWRNDGQLAVSSPGAPNSPFVPLGSGVAQRFSTTEHAGQQWRLLVMTHPSGRFEVHAAKPQIEMQQDLLKAARTTLPAALLLLAALMVGLWLAVSWAFASVRSVRQAIEARSELDLTPISLGRLPEEMRPVIVAFNHLLSRLSAAMAHEKRFISNAAHELRTPLAALRAQAQVAQRLAGETPGGAPIGESLAKLITIIDRATRLAQQLLTFARFESTPLRPTEPLLALDALTVDVAHEFTELARQRALQLRVQAEPAQVVGDSEQISALLRNLIDNAMRYTPSGGVVVVECHAEAAYATLAVADSGPGIPEAEHTLVFERFYRGHAVTQPGSGLGLAIVREVAERHRGRVRLLGGLAAGGGGLRVEVQLPAAAAWQVAS